MTAKAAMSVKTLSDRMKQYEKVTDVTLPFRVPIVGRIDGKAFHTFTKGEDKPFSREITRLFRDSMVELCDSVQGCVFGYTQSDEISFVIRTDQSEETDPWYSNRLQKIASVASSIVTAYFNKHFSKDKLARFDCRVFTLPNIEEVMNYILWRQRDCVRNSVSMVAQHELGKIMGRKTALAALHGVNADGQIQMLKENNIDYYDYNQGNRMGFIAYKHRTQVQIENKNVYRNKWVSTPAVMFNNCLSNEWLENVLNFYVGEGYGPQEEEI
jgi:tRNA(His) guanylyltransferase